MSTSIEATLDVVGIVAADVPASLAFYRRLGLDIPADADTQPHVDITLPNGMRLTWDSEKEIRSFHPNWSGGPNGKIALAFRLAGPAEVDGAYHQMVAAGATGELEPFDAFWGQRYATLRDPDGNGVDLFAPLSATPASEHTESGV
jgi:catechol 2,3-dioxygenase-like lactoylglutathione lyase family enzyme